MEGRERLKGYRGSVVGQGLQTRLRRRVKLDIILDFLFSFRQDGLEIYAMSQCKTQMYC
jgi:hypothetical protein